MLRSTDRRLSGLTYDEVDGRIHLGNRKESILYGLLCVIDHKDRYRTPRWLEL